MGNKQNQKQKAQDIICKMQAMIIDKLNDKKGIVQICSQNIGNQGVQYLCSQDTHNAIQLILYNNLISSQGLLQFSKANWTNLVYLNLRKNKIGDLGCKYLSRANLCNIEYINLNANQIREYGLRHLQKTKWKALKQFYINRNPLCIQILQWLTSVNWPKITMISSNQQEFINENSNQANLAYLVILELEKISQVWLNRRVYSGNVYSANEIRNENFLKNKFCKKILYF